VTLPTACQCLTTPPKRPVCQASAPTPPATSPRGRPPCQHSAPPPPHAATPNQPCSPLPRAPGSAARRALGLAIAQGIGAVDGPGGGRWAALEGRTTYERLRLSNFVKTDPFSGGCAPVAAVAVVYLLLGGCSAQLPRRCTPTRLTGAAAARRQRVPRRLPAASALSSAGFGGSRPCAPLQQHRQPPGLMPSQPVLTPCAPPPYMSGCRAVRGQLRAPRPRAAAGVPPGGGRPRVGGGHQADRRPKRASWHHQLEGADRAGQPAAGCAAFW
jgi:hypothetical protein